MREPSTTVTGADFQSRPKKAELFGSQAFFIRSIRHSCRQPYDQGSLTR